MIGVGHLIPIFIDQSDERNTGNLKTGDGGKATWWEEGGSIMLAQHGTVHNTHGPRYWCKLPPPQKKKCTQLTRHLRQIWLSAVVNAMAGGTLYLCSIYYMSPP